MLTFMLTIQLRKRVSWSKALSNTFWQGMISIRMPHKHPERKGIPAWWARPEVYKCTNAETLFQWMLARRGCYNGNDRTNGSNWKCFHQIGESGRWRRIRRRLSSLQQKQTEVVSQHRRRSCDSYFAFHNSISRACDSREQSQALLVTYQYQSEVPTPRLNPKNPESYASPDEKVFSNRHRFCPGEGC